MWSRGRLLRTLVVASGALAVGYLYRESRPPELVRSPEVRQCIRAIDGDTLEIDGGERVRLIGVDTPESVDPGRAPEYFGKEAAAFTGRMAQGKPVRLEFDEQSYDVYGRTLAYVYLQDGSLLNAEIIRQGYGYAYTRFPFRF